MPTRWPPFPRNRLPVEASLRSLLLGKQHREVATSWLHREALDQVAHIGSASLSQAKAQWWKRLLTARRCLDQVEPKRGGAPPVPERPEGHKGILDRGGDTQRINTKGWTRPNSYHFMCEPEKDGAARQHGKKIIKKLQDHGYFKKEKACGCFWESAS